MKVSVIVPEDYMGDVIGDLNSRRGQIQAWRPAPAPSRSTLRALGRDVRLCHRSALPHSGRGQYTMEPSHYVEIPKNIRDKIVETRNKPQA